MGNFISQYAKDNRVESIIHITNMIVRAGMQIKSDKKSDTDYFVMSGNTVEDIINAYQNKNAKSALVIDDLGLQVINRLKQEGVTDITLCLTRIPEKMFALTKARIKKTFKDFNINIISLEELTYMKVDLLISNPAYGAIGANITDTLRQKIDYKEFINLLPANDYKRNKTKDLFKYQSNMTPISNGFTDAAVTTHVARIHKGTVDDPAPNINMTLDEFERSQYIDRSLDKYFEENSKRTHYAIDNAQARPKWTKYIQETVTVDNSFIIHMRDANHGYIPNNANKKNPATSVRWNLLRELSLDYLHEHYWQNDTQSVYGFITFKTVIERNNFTDFMLKHGWTFMCKVMKAMCVDCTVAFSKYLPKVDWTRSWTVEEILKDYGYTEDEIKTVMADLDNFKGMDD